MKFKSLARLLAGLRVDGSSSFGKLTEPTETVDVQGNIAVSGTVDGVSVSSLPGLIDSKADETITITAGDGLSGGGDLTADLTLTNADKGSSQFIFKNIEISGQTTITAGSNTDSLTLSGNTDSNYSNLTLTTDDTTNTVDVSLADSPEFASTQFDLTSAVTPAVGELAWNSASNTLNLGVSSNVTLQVGQEFIRYVANNTGSEIPNGSVVYALGVQSPQLSVAPFIADGSINADRVVGVTTEAIPDGASGFITSKGLVRNVDTSAFLGNTILYASSVTPGAFTDVEPESPNLKVVLGFVTNSDAAGSIDVNIHSTPIAADITYDNASTTLLSSNVQAALDELDASKASIDTLSSNINLYPTTAASDIANHNRLVTELTDADYDDPAADVSTGVITTADQVVGQLISDAGIFVGNPGVINITTIGNIRRVSGNKTASFYFRLFKRDSSGTEVQLAESDPTPEVSASTYTQFNASAILNNGEFLDTDRIVIRYYATPTGTGNNPTYEFEFGGDDPVRTLLPVPVTVIPAEDATGIFTDTTNFNNILSNSEDTVQKALDVLDDHTHTTSEIAEGSRLYFTTTRANAAIDARVDKTFVDALNVDADTLDGFDSTDFAAVNHNHTSADITDFSTAVQNEVDKTYVDSLNVDADTLDGLDSTAFAAASHTHTASEITDFPTAVQTEVDKAYVDSLNVDADTLDGQDSSAFVLQSEVGSANGVAGLDANGTVPSSQLPALSLSEVYVVVDNIERDALTVQEGDVAKVTSTGLTFIWDGTVWVEITADSAVDSVNGQTGTVSLNSDNIAEGTTNLYYASSLFDADFFAKTTDNLTEGTTNRYYSSTLANADIDTRVDKTFVDALGVDAATVGGELPSAFADAVHTHTLSDITDAGTAAAADTTDFATAAQGSLADTAVQPGDDADTLGSGDALDGYVLRADGLGGAAWEEFSAPVTSVNSQTGDVILDTDDISEGTNNLYYTDAKVNAAIDVRVDKTFVDALNVDADTLDGIDSTGFDEAGLAVAMAIALG